MHKCNNCGTEYEGGSFCPECGTRVDGKRVCQYCGAMLETRAKFCSECGRSVAGGALDGERQNVGYGANGVRASDTLRKVYIVCKYLPTSIFVLFAALMFVFMALPVAQASMLGVKQSLGSIYQLNILSASLKTVTGAAIATLALSIVAAVTAAVTAIMRIKKRTDGGRYAVVYTVLYISFIITLAAAMALIKAFDGGAGLVRSGACTTLTLVFAIIFAVMTVAAVIAEKVLRANSEVRAAVALREQTEQERIMLFQATHDLPELKADTKRCYVQYKHDLRRWERGKAGSTPAAVVWLDLHKVSLAVTALAIIAVAVTLSIVVPIVTSIFRADKVRKVKLGDDMAAVTAILGEPTAQTESMFEYYDDDAKSLIKKIDAADKAGDLQTALELGAKLENLKFKYIRITFDYGIVDSVILDTEYNIKGFEKKEVKKCKIDKDRAVRQEEYKDNKFIRGELLYIEYCADFKDGSFIRMHSNNIQRDEKGWKFADGIAEYRNIPIFEVETAIEFVDGKPSIENRAKIEKAKLPEYGGAKYIGMSDDPYRLLFEVKDKNSASLTVHPNTKYIDEYALEKCEFTSITVPTAVLRSLRLRNVVNVTINGGETINGGAFKNCNSLTSIKIPDSVMSIGDSAFSDCSNLTSINYTGKKMQWKSIEKGNSWNSNTGA